MSQTGSILVFSAVSLVMLVSFAALVVDLGFAFVARNELHNIADGAALAGTRQLGVIYEALPYNEQQTYVMSGADRTAIINAVSAVGSANRAGSASISINSADVSIGQWNMSTKILTVTATHPDAVRVKSRRDGTANGPITTFLAEVMGFTAMNISTQATAALTPISTTLPGELDLPVGISQQWFQANSCNNNIQFYPTNSAAGCAGWSTFEASPSNASGLRSILQGLDAGTFQPPGATTGQTQFNFIGGNVASALPDLRQLFLDKGAVNPDTGVFEWKTFVAVYSSTDCSNPSGAITIVGFATVIITNVLAPPAGQLIQGTVQCQLLETGRGGGAGFGTVGTLPGLVQ
jgi:Flp pilus assembly protein TadG